MDHTAAWIFTVLFLSCFHPVGQMDVVHGIKLCEWGCTLLLLVSRSVLPDSLWPRGLQHTRLPCPSLSPGIVSNSGVVSCPLSQWCYLTFSSFAALFSLWLQSSTAPGSFPINRLFASGGQSIGTSVSVLSMNIQRWLPLGLTGLISLQSKELSRAVRPVGSISSHYLVLPNKRQRESSIEWRQPGILMG